MGRTRGIAIEFINCPTSCDLFSLYISVGSSTCFGCWHPSSGARTAVITASGIHKLQWVKYAATIYWMFNSNIQYNQSRILNYTLVLIAAYFTHCS